MEVLRIGINKGNFRIFSRVDINTVNSFGVEELKESGLYHVPGTDGKYTEYFMTLTYIESSHEEHELRDLYKDFILKEKLKAFVDESGR